MTGHVGERTNRAVALVTDDFRVYHEVSRYLADRGVTVLGLRPDEPVPPSVRVLVGGPTSDDRSVALHGDMDVVWLRIQAGLDARDGPPHVVIGVDPGRTFGFAMLVDGHIYDVAESTPEDAVERVMRWMESIPARAWTVHVGDGAPDVGTAFATQLARMAPTAAIVFVHEAASSPASVQTRSRHTDAAVHIAMRRPL